MFLKGTSAVLLLFNTTAGWGKVVLDKEYTKPTQQLKITNQTQGDYVHDAETQK